MDAALRPPEIASGAATIGLSGDIGNGIFSVYGRSGLIVTPGTGITSKTVNLSSGEVSLTGGTITGRVSISPTGVLSGSPGVVVTAAVAPVSLPAALPLFVTGLGFVSLALKCRRIT